LDKHAPKKIRGQLRRKAQSLMANPHPPGTKLIRKASDAGNRVYRIRSGDYRILYSVQRDQIVVLDIDNRKDVYRGTT
jgi:mRNA interferase RelE/StbE